MRERLDQLLVIAGHYATRSRAADAVRRGCVSVDGKKTLRASEIVDDGARIEIDDPAHQYVSRAALKLKAALAASGLSPQGRNALDLGASTGGFKQVLLEAGARHVWAVDVGHGQLDAKIVADPRVTKLEGVNARHLALATLDGIRPQFVTADVSFISLKLALPPALMLAEPGAGGIFLVKPQFELGAQAIGRTGVVRDSEAAFACAVELGQWLDAQLGWRKTHLIESPLAGGEGNREWLIAGIKDK